MLPPTAMLRFKIDALPFVVAACLFLQGLNSTIIATSLPAIALDLDANAVTVGAALTVYNAAALLVIPCGAWLADQFGAKRVMIISMIGFILASVACSFAPSLDWFLLGRVGQGISAALLAPLGRAVVLQNTPRLKTVRAMATIAWPALTAPVLGPILGAYVVTHWGWHWIFLLNLPLGLFVLGMIIFIIPRSRIVKVRQFDFLGYALVSMTVMALFLCVESVSHGWSWAIAGAAFLVGILAGFGARKHLLNAKDPLFDLRVLGIANFSITTMYSGTILRIMMGVAPFALPLILQLGHGMSAMRAGTMMMIYFIANLTAKTFTTWLFNKLGFRPVLTVNGLICALATLSFGVLPLNVDWVLYGALIVAGATRSIQLTGLNTLAVADISHGQKASAMTISTLMQQFALAASISVATMFIHLSQVWHGTENAQLVDFQWAFVATGILGFMGCAALFRLKADAGEALLTRSPVKTAKSLSGGLVARWAL